MADATYQFESVAAWQDALERAFHDPAGPAVQRATSLDDFEHGIKSELTRKCYGFKVLMDCLQLHTLDTFFKSCTIAPAPSILDYAFRVATFRRLRSSLNAFWTGYPLEALASVRSIWENLLFMGAVCNNYIRSEDFTPSSAQLEEDRAKERSVTRMLRDQRMRTEGAVRDRMRGKDSGLSEADQDTIADLLDLYHVHVHRCESAVFDICGKTNDSRQWAMTLSEPTERDRCFYTNHTVVAAWAFCRVLPFLPTPAKFDAPWKSRRDALERAFDYYVAQLCETKRSESWPAMRRMIQQKFSFAG